MQKVLLILLIIIIGFNFSSFAQGDLLVTPNRVIFDGNKQKEELSLVNMGKDTASYSISFVQRNMKEDGSFVNVEKLDSGQMFADTYLRVFPRRVTLAPGEPQVIMLQCRRKTDMKAGEYRSHLYFRSEKSEKPLGMKGSAKDSTLLSVQLIPIFGISIPVIIRTGIVSVSALLSDLKLETQKDASQNLKLTINRIGNISIYGNLTVEFFPSQSPSSVIGVLNGVGVYTSIDKRNISIKLNNTTGKPLTTGKLKVKYSSNDDKKTVVYAEAELELK
jgi:hypothetical protein